MASLSVLETRSSSYPSRIEATSRGISDRGEVERPRHSWTSPFENRWTGEISGLSLGAMH